MASKWSVVVAVPVLMFGSSISEAQTCMGQPSLREVRYNVGVNKRMVTQGNGVDARAAVGNTHIFGNATAGKIWYSAGDNRQRSYRVDGGGGYAVSKGNFSACPYVSVNHEDGPGNDVIRLNTKGFVGGLSIGGVLPLGQAAGLVMVAGSGYERRSAISTAHTRVSGAHFSRSGMTSMAGVGLALRQHVLQAQLSFYTPAGYFTDPWYVNDEHARGYFVFGVTFSPPKHH